MPSQITTYNHGVEWEETNGVSQGYCVNGTIYTSGQCSHDMTGAFVGWPGIAVLPETCFCCSR